MQLISSKLLAALHLVGYFSKKLDGCLEAMVKLKKNYIVTDTIHWNVYTREISSIFPKLLNKMFVRKFIFSIVVAFKPF